MHCNSNHSNRSNNNILPFTILTNSFIYLHNKTLNVGYSRLFFRQQRLSLVDLLLTVQFSNFRFNIHITQNAKYTTGPLVCLVQEMWNVKWDPPRVICANRLRSIARMIDINGPVRQNKKRNFFLVNKFNRMIINNNRSLNIYIDFIFFVCCLLFAVLHWHAKSDSYFGWW